MTNRMDEFAAELGKGKGERVQSRIEKMAKKIIDEQVAMIDALTEPKMVFKRRRRKVNSKGTFLRVVCGDNHGSAGDPTALNALYDDLEILKPAELVHTGDMIDCGGFLAEHHTLNYVPETTYTYANDIHCASLFLDTVAKSVGKMHYVMGNHERRVEKWCIQIAAKGRSDREFVQDRLMKSLSPQALLQLDARGINYVCQGVTDDGQFVPATIRLGKSLYTHTGSERGSSTGAKMMQLFQTNVAFGHTHKAGVWFAREAGTGTTMIARNNGCLCMRQPLWRNSDPTGWTQGYGLEVVREDGSFLALHIPIVDGESMLGDFAHLLNL